VSVYAAVEAVSSSYTRCNGRQKTPVVETYDCFAGFSASFTVTLTLILIAVYSLLLLSQKDR